MNTILLKKYSQLIIEKGVNLQKNQSVVIVASVYSADLVRILTEECYKHGAKKVRVQFNDEIISKHQYKNEKVENLSDIMKFIALEREEVINNNGVYIRILSDIPGIFKDIDSTKLSTIVKNNRSHLSTIMKKVTNSDIQ
jgi:aminopeptidase